MKQISRITTQVKNKERFNIFVTDGTTESYGFSVAMDVLVEFNLRKGMDLPETLINQLIQRDTLHKSYAKVLNYLGYRVRTEKEIRDYLRKDEVDEEHIREIIDKLHERKLLDDQEFAYMFVRTRIQTTEKGPITVGQELRAKGVAKDKADQAVSLYTYEVQCEKAASVVKKRLQRTNTDSFTKQTQKIRALLMRRGFTGDVINDVLADIDDYKDDEQEWAALEAQGERLMRRHKQRFTGYDLNQKVKEGLYRQGFQMALINTYLEAQTEAE